MNNRSSDEFANIDFELRVRFDFLLQLIIPESLSSCVFSFTFIVDLELDYALNIYISTPSLSSGLDPDLRDTAGGAGQRLR